MRTRASSFAALLLTASWMLEGAVALRAGEEPGGPRRPSAPPAAEGPRPTLADVRYGPHRRNVLDYWRADSDRPTPVLVYFHGGSFKAGDKAQFRGRVAEYLEAGISVVSANYRFSDDAPFPGPMHDGARAVQFIRSRASDWKIDPARIALSGGSAGGTLALWVALHDDLADPDSPDPVARLSTRGTCFLGFSTPTTLDPEAIRESIGSTNLGAAMLRVLGVEAREQLLTPAMRAVTAEASPLAHASRDDPPLMLIYGQDLAGTPMPADAPQKQWIHHPRFGELLKAEYDRLGLACSLYYKSKPAPAGTEVAFLVEHFAGGPAGGAEAGDPAGARPSSEFRERGEHSRSGPGGGPMPAANAPDEPMAD